MRSWSPKLTAHLCAFGIAVAVHGPVSVARSETLYVVDTVVVLVRADPGEDGEILARLVSGDQVERLDETVEPYVKIALPDRREGWVDVRYLTPEPVARNRLQEITEKHGELREQLELSQAARRDAEESLVQLSDDYERLSEELEQVRRSSLQPNQPFEELDRLQAELEELRTEADLLERRNKELKEASDWRWFLTGSGVLAAGLLLGALLPRARRRRSTWDRF